MTPPPRDAAPPRDPVPPREVVVGPHPEPWPEDPRLDPELLAQEATLSQIQREFCDMAVGACRAAWG